MVASVVGAMLALCFPSAHAQPVRVEVRGSQISGPAQQDTGDAEWFARMTNWRRDTADAFGEWLQALRLWRQEQLAGLHYDDAQYRRPELLWTQRNFVQPQAMVEERYLFDPVARRYTVDRYLDDLDRRYGGIDSVLLWPVYPNIGIDNRNQWDLARDMPGGISALRTMVQDFHRRGVRVFFPTMPWDTGTRDVGISNAQATAELMAEIGADGINGDTMDGLPLEYRTASDATGRPVALEPELSPRDDAMLAYNQQSWAYWDHPFVPMVSKWKWLESRHVSHVCDRWAADRTDVLQSAAQGTDGRLFPWGNAWDTAAVPAPCQGRDLPAPAAVDAHPNGASPYGVEDMVANVWQWTDEYVDEHTRTAILRGGSFYQPQGSYWYFPQACKLNEHGKYLLMAPSKDRAGTLGFRCVVDAG